MALTKKLQAQIEKYLETRKKSTGGWAPVDEGEVEALGDIVGALIAAKYEMDPDGDLPVSVQLTDRTRYKTPYVLLVPHIRDEKVTDVSGILEAVSRHASMAKVNSEAADSLMQTLRWDLRRRSNADGPLVVEGKVYRAAVAPNAGVELTEEWLTAAAVKVFTREERKHPCPADRDQRDAWAKRLVEQLKESWGVHVESEGCRLTTRGVQVSLRIPALDLGLIVMTGGEAAQN